MLIAKPRQFATCTTPPPRTKKPGRRRPGWRQSPANAISRRKAIYLELHPDTAQHVAGGHAKHGSASDNLSFASETSKATGKDKRTIERAAARGAALGDDLQAIAGTSLDKGVELDALAKMRPEEREPLGERVRRHLTCRLGSFPHGWQVFLP